MGLDSLASAISEDPETVSVVIEPYLVQLNFIARTSQGRVITDLGRTISQGSRQRFRRRGRCAILTFAKALTLDNVREASIIN